MDFFATFAELSKAKLLEGLVIDGKSFADVIFKNEKSKYDYFYYYAYTHLQAVRDKEWKLVLARPDKPKYMGWWARKIDAVNEVQLFNLKTDSEEQVNLASKYPEKVKELMSAIEKGRKELGDNDVIGSGARFFDDNPKNKRLNKYNSWLERKK